MQEARPGGGDARAPLAPTNARRRRSRSRSQQEEVDRLLMAGRPSSLAAAGNDGLAGTRSGGSWRGSAAKEGQRGRQGAWVSPLVLA